MIAALSLTSLCVGATLAGCAPRARTCAATVETCGGTLFMSGLVLLGACLPLFR